MKIGVSLKINCSQIDKARLFAGQKGQYLDATVFIDVDQLDQYGKRHSTNSKRHNSKCNNSAHNKRHRLLASMMTYRSK